MAQVGQRCSQNLSLQTLILLIQVTLIFCDYSTLNGYVAETPTASFENNVHKIHSETCIVFRVFGQNIKGTTMISFTSHEADRGSNCDDMRETPPYFPSDVDDQFTMATYEITFDETSTLYFCVKDSDENETGVWVHQGSSDWLSFKVIEKPKGGTLLPLPLQIAVIFVLLLCSALFSGLNLGLMSLDKTELKVLQNCGTKREQTYAKTVSKVRRHGNYLLCTVLLGNVLVNSSLTLLMSELTGSGPVAIIAATGCIVVFGEIVPQAICSRYGLAIGARTIWFTWFFMVLTFPLSFPISKILDCVLGEEMGNVMDRNRLRELLKETSTDLKKDEMNIIAGALELSKKTVVDIMTKIEDVFMLELATVLDFETVSEIMKTGYTRIPVYESDKSNIVNLLNIKDLAFIDPDDRTPLSTVCKFYNHEVKFVYDDDRLDDMLTQFKRGQYHMAFVRRVNNEGPQDPYHEILGVVTLEDVIEEIIQAEIMDETDTVTDNRSKIRRKNAQNKTFSLLNKGATNYLQLSPQLLLATLQYLSTSVPAFKPEAISHTVLERLLNQNVVFTLRLNVKRPDDEQHFLYCKNKPADFFVLLLQGRVEVEVGKDAMRFEAGPFTYFGLPAILGSPSGLSKQPSFSSLSTDSETLYMSRVSYVPDFQVLATSDLQYVRIRRAHYIAAKRATAMERRDLQAGVNTPTDDAFQKEWLRATSVDPGHNQTINVSSGGASLGGTLLPGSNLKLAGSGRATPVKSESENLDIELANVSSNCFAVTPPSYEEDIARSRSMSDDSALEVETSNSVLSPLIATSSDKDYMENANNKPEIS